MNSQYLMDRLSEEQFLSEDLLKDFENYTSSFRDEIVTKNIRENELIPLLSEFKKYRSYDNKVKGRVQSYLEKLIHKTVELKCNSVSDHKRKRVFQLLNSVLEIKKIEFISGDFSYQELESLSNLLSSHSVSPYELIDMITKNSESEEDIQLTLESIDTELLNSLSTLSNKLSLYSTVSNSDNSTQFNSTVSTESQCDTGYSEDIEHYTKRGGGVSSFAPLLVYKITYYRGLAINVERLIGILNKVIQFREGSILVFNSPKRKEIVSKMTRLLIHLSKSIGYEDNWIPIPRLFLEKNGLESLTQLNSIDRSTGETNSSLYVLKHLGLINIRKYSHQDGKCRELQLTDLGKIVLGVLSVQIERPRAKQLDLLPGDLTESSMDFAYYKDKFIPNITLIQQAISSLNTVKINIPQYLKKMRESNPILQMTEEDYIDFIMTNLEDIENDILPIDVKSISNFHNDIQRLTSGNNIKIDKKGNWSFKNIFTLSSTGRVFAKNGTQGATRQTKHVLYDGYINYDIPNSQMNLLIQMIEDVHEKYSREFTESDMEAFNGLSYLKQYVSGKIDKKALSKSLNISVDDWKKSLYTLVFGGVISKSKQSSIGEIVRRNNWNPKFSSTELFKELDKFKKPIDLWLKYCQRYCRDQVLTTEQKLDLYSSMSFISPETEINHEDYCFNGIVYLNCNSDFFQDVRKVSAFMLQGIESAFIFYIMIAPGARGLLNPVSYEFDGIVVEFDIDDDYVEYAKMKSGFRNAILIKKPVL